MLDKSAPFRSVRFIERDVSVDRLDDGTILLRNNVPMWELSDHIPALFRAAAAAHPDRIWLAQRRGPERAWHSLTYGDARRTVDAVTQWLLDLSRPAAPVMILSDNSVEGGALIVSAMHAGMPVTPVSSAYSLRASDHGKLRAMVDFLKPAVIFVQDTEAFAPALRDLDLAEVTVLTVTDGAPEFGAVLWADAAATAVTPQVDQSVAAINHDTVAKYLFTSGSTGTPKAVITTQRMLCANVAMTEQLIEPHDPNLHHVRLEWLPWSHVMAGNFIFNATLYRQGSLYIDDGRPAPSLFQETLRNLAEIKPTSYANVPIGYAMLVAAMEKDDSLAKGFFENVPYLSYAGARLPDDVYLRMQRLSIKHTGHKIPFLSGYGATETSPSAFYVFWAVDQTGLIGLPHPGVTAKLVPLDDDRYEVRVQHLGVTPGYLHQPELHDKLFDEDGFVRMGDAAEFVNCHAPEEGMVFAGRVSEEFKLMSGTFVRAGTLRVKVVEALAPLVSDLVLTGADREFIGSILWPNADACRQFLGLSGASLTELAQNPVLRDEIARRLAVHNEAHGASSMSIARFAVMDEPPSLGTGEITDKGYINQRTVLERRAHVVEAIHSDNMNAIITVVSKTGKQARSGQ